MDITIAHHPGENTLKCKFFVSSLVGSTVITATTAQFGHRAGVLTFPALLCEQKLRGAHAINTACLTKLETQIRIR